MFSQEICHIIDVFIGNIMINGLWKYILQIEIYFSQHHPITHGWYGKHSWKFPTSF